MAEPTTAPSAIDAIALAFSGVLIPNPTITGRSVDDLIRATSGPTFVAAAVAEPVIPLIET
jgi:hypothetical protein